jgi:SprT protein
VVQRTHELTAAAPSLIARHAATPHIRFDLRGQAAGQFRLGPGGEPVIRYNPALLARHEAEFLAQTVPHEVAHYLAYLRFGRGIRPHGPEWQQIMHALGADPRRCHDFDVSGLATRRMRRHVYHCRCGEHALTSIRHHRILRGASYVCRTCGQPLQRGAGAAARQET